MSFVKFNTLEVSFKGHMFYQFRKQELFFFDRSAQIRAATEKHIAIFFLKLKLKLCWTFSHTWKGTKAKSSRTSVTLQVSSPLVTSESAGSLNRATLLQFIAKVSRRHGPARRCAARNHLRLFPLCDQSGRWSMPNVFQAPTPRCLVAPGPPQPTCLG